MFPLETTALYYPQVTAHIGPYSFTQGIEIEIHSAKTSYFDWAKIRFTKQYKPKISLNPQSLCLIEMGYNGVLNEVFTGYAVKPYDGGTYADEITMKDEMMLLESTIINDTFMDTTPQEMISFFLAKAGVSKSKLSSRHYPVRRLVSIRKQTARQAIDTVNAAWNIRVPFFFSGGVFYWDEKPEQSKVYTFEYGVNIIRLSRTSGVWELETISAPFVKHSHKINVIHPRINGEFEVSKVVSTTNESGFIRTYIYF